MLLRGFVIAALMFVSSVSLSAPTSEEVVFTQRDGFVTLRGENGLWILEGFKIAKDGWQDSVWREAYPTVEQTQKRIKQLGLSASAAQTRSAILLQKGERELRSLANPPLWKVTQAWSWAWEQKYADWINAEIDPQFFVKYQIPTDCADVAYALRWIFARNNGLPQAVRLSGSGATFTQDSTRSEWMQYPTGGKWFEDKRFMKSLNWMTNNTYTHTLFHDSYPIAITQEALLAGSHHLALHGQSGHTQVIFRTFYNDPAKLPIKMMASTVPRSVRSLYETEFWESSQPVEKSSGILRFRWAVKTSSGTSLVPATSMPHYSKMQYQPEFMKEQGFFALAVLKSLNPSFTFESWLEKGFLGLKEQIEARKLVVEEGAKVCGTRGCAPGTADYENWSTPSRDARIRELFLQLRTVKDRIGSSLDEVWKNMMAMTAVQIAGVDYTLKHVVWTWEHELYSPEPQMSVDQRWGLDPVAFAKNIKLRMEQNLAERESKIKKQGSVCRASGSCAIGSTEWTTWNTFQSDALLSRLRVADQDYCVVASAASCAGYSTARNLQTVTGAGRTAPIEEWLVDILWLNSDPRQPEAIRWGSLKNEFHWTLVPYGKALWIAKNGWSLDFAATDRLTNVDNGSVHLAPQGFKFTQLVLDGSYAFAKNDTSTEFVVLNLSTFVETRIPIDPDETIQNNGAGLIFNNFKQHVVRLFSFAGDMNQPRVFQNAESALYFSNDNLYFVSYLTSQPEVQSFALVDASTLVATPFEVKVGKKFTFDYMARSRSHVLGLIFREGSPNTFVAIDLATGIHTERQDLEGFQIYLPGSGHALFSEYDQQRKMQYASIVSIDEAFKIHSKQIVGSWWNEIKAPAACVYSTNSGFEITKKTCFRYTGKSIDPQSLVISDRVLETWDDTYFGSSAKIGDTVSLASWKSPNTVLVTAPRIYGNGNGFFTIYPRDTLDMMFLEAARAHLGVFFTLANTNNPISRQKEPASYAGFQAGRGHTIGLPSGESIWIDQPAN